MSWYRFWMAGERTFERFHSVALTLVVLKFGGYLLLPLTPIIVCAVVGTIGSLTCAACVGATTPTEPARDHQ